jgi:hypothetical protein
MRICFVSRSLHHETLELTTVVHKPRSRLPNLECSLEDCRAHLFSAVVALEAGFDLHLGF